MALPTSIALEIVTPDRPLVRETVDEVVLPATEGELGVLPGHTPLLTTLKVGVLMFRMGDERHYVAVSHGFAEVLSDRVTVLAQVAERGEDVDVSRAEAARRRAEERLSHPGPETDAGRARMAWIKATVRLQAASKARARA
jgi:F-type H+-transporting ATPase subunit epsilon